MSLAGFALKRPYTIIATLMLICIMGIGAGLRMPIDIFPDVTRAISQLASSALVVLKCMPPNIMPPLVLRHGATDVPIIQLSLSSNSLPDTKLNDLGQNIIRPDLAVVHGAEVAYPYGGKPRVIMVDLDQDALAERSLTPADVAAALQRQNVILPYGDVKTGETDYSLAMNSSPSAIAAIGAFPVKEIDGRTIFIRDVAHVLDGYQIQTNSVSVDGRPGALISVRKTGGVSTLAIVDGVREAFPDIRKLMPAGVDIKAIFDQSVFVNASLDSVLMGGAMAAGLTAMMILLGCSSSFARRRHGRSLVPSWKPKIVRSMSEFIVATWGTIRAMIPAASDEPEIGQCR
jgi:multidrug efflux pump subunit AcrB